MKSTMYITFIIIIGILLIIGGVVVSMEKGEYTISSIKTYTDPNGAFIFNYPEFKGWNGNLRSNNPYFVDFSYDQSQGAVNFFVAPSIQVSVERPATKHFTETTFYYSPKEGTISFEKKTPETAFVIVKIPQLEEFGFSGKKMAEEILRSFKFTEDKNEARAIEIAKKELMKLPRFQDWMKEGWEYTVSARKGSEPNIWSVNFDVPRHATDQGILILVDVSKNVVVMTDVHME